MHLPLEICGSLSPTGQPPCMGVAPCLDTSHSAGGDPGSHHRQDCTHDTGMRTCNHMQSLCWVKLCRS